MSQPEIKVQLNASQREISLRNDFFRLFKQCPIPENEMLSTLGLFLNRQTLSRILVMHELYKRIIGTKGVVMEFGVRWGQNLALFESFRGMYEPYDHSRKIVGFDTFEGFPSVHPKNGTSEVAARGSYAVTQNYVEYLTHVLDYHEQESPLQHMKKYELVKGDASITCPQYLAAHPETIVALAYFDMDLYAPTKRCLEAISSHLTKGSVIGFDELNYSVFPGETVALREVFGLDRYRIQALPLNPAQSFIVIE
jgi:hypothetical protein